MLNDIRDSLVVSAERRWSALWSPGVRWALFIAIGFTVLQQVTGINTVFYYGPQIFQLAGITSDKAPIFSTFILAALNVLATIIALPLVDRVGRKPLLYCGVGGMTLSLFCCRMPSTANWRLDRRWVWLQLHAWLSTSLLCLQHGPHWLDNWSRRSFRCGCAAAA